MTRIATLGLCACLFTVSARAAQPAASTAVPLERDAVSALTSWLSDVAGHLSGALKRDTPSQAALLALARDRGELISSVVEIRQGLPTKKGAEPRTHFTGVTVVATAWFGIVPVARAELMLWVAKGELRVLRFRRQTAPMRAFLERRGPTREDAPGKALATLVDQVLAASTSGRCDTLPLLSVADVRAASPNHSLPPQSTREVMERFAAEAKATCESLAGTPFHRGSYGVIELSGVLAMGKERGRPFNLTLTTSTEGALQLGTLSPPQ
ncbi:MAG: hypothetical protein R3F39_12985 [Myxococcota bacterium]